MLIFVCGLFFVGENGVGEICGGDGFFFDLRPKIGEAVGKQCLNDYQFFRFGSEIC